MSYPSVDKLQNLLATEIFQHTKDSKKAAGRALGTLVEIIAFYLLKAWGLSRYVSIERGLEEYGNPDITHNVEYSLHPVRQKMEIVIEDTDSVTSNIVLKELEKQGFSLDGFEKKNNSILKNGIARNACTVAISDDFFLICNITNLSENKINISVCEQFRKSFSIFECKRVGVEEGMKKGPQTIEKAKQGAYVARTLSSLQKIRTERGELYGVIYKTSGEPLIKPFEELMEDIVYSDDKELLRRFILTVGVVSNHGNWFAAENQNKEMKVLVQSYDWLLFLTDNGLAKFIGDLLFHPSQEFQKIREVFLASYAKEKKKNSFTKVQMDTEADALLKKYFSDHLSEIEGWFNVISPGKKSISTLKNELENLANKNWKEVLQ